MKAEIIQSEDSCLAIQLPHREMKIAELAYYKAENRGFEQGYDLDDWLAAELEC